jgi:hypothetical protein
MKVKDERIKVTNEVMVGMRIIKLYAWESRWAGGGGAAKRRASVW